MIKIMMNIFYVLIIIVLIQANTIFVRREKKQRENAIKNYDIMESFKQWLINRIKGYSVEKFFVDNNCKSIAIYGVGHLGEVLIRELKESSITIKYAIDKKASNIFSDIEIIDPEDEYEDVDAFVVTPVSGVEDIIKLISSKTTKPIYTIEDVIYHDFP